MKNVLKLENEVMSMSTLFAIVTSTFREQQNIPLPLELISHFLPNTEITQERFLEVLCRHARLMTHKEHFMMVCPNHE